MNVSFDAIVIPNGVCALSEAAVADALVFHSDRSLVAASWPDLWSADVPAPVVVGECAAASVIATDVGVDTAWTVGGAESRVYLARRGELDVIELGDKRPVRRIQVAQLESSSFAAATDADCRRVLLVIERMVNPDFSEYSLAEVDLASGGLTLEAGRCGLIDLQVVWSRHLASWVIGATSGGAIWRWDGSGPKVLLADASPEVHASTLVCDRDGAVHASWLTESAQGDVLLTTGHVGSRGIQWSPPVNVGPGLTCAFRSPNWPVWACLRQSGADQFLQIRDTSGAVLAETRGSRASYLDQLYWSRNSDNRLWGIGPRTLAAVTIRD